MIHLIIVPNLILQKEPSPLHKEFCEGLIDHIPVAYSLPDSVVCGTCYNYLHDSKEMESNEDLKLYEQPLPSAGEEVGYRNQNINHTIYFV